MARFPTNRPLARLALRALPALLILFFFIGGARAQVAGTVDPGFVATAGGFGSPVVNRVVLQPDGKFFVVGSYQVAGGSPRRGLARFNADGTLDSGFDANLNGFARSVAVDGAGRIIVTGSFTAVNGVTRNQIARLNADGSLDPSFAGGAGLSDGFTTVGAEAIVLDAAGGVILGGTFKQVHGAPRNGIARLNPDGSLDTAFNPGTDSSGKVFAIRSDSNGRLLVGGLFTQIGGLSSACFARLNADGSGDATFNSGTGALGPVRDIEFDGNGKILICGMFSQYNSATQARVARLNADGSLDGTFAPLVTSSQTTPDLKDLAVDSQGRILIAGTFSAINAVARSFLARLNPDGSLDTGFDISPTLTFSGFNSVVVTTGDRLLVGGFFPSFGDIRRLNTNGSVDATFPTSRITSNGTVTALTLDGSGRLIVGGFLNSINGVTRGGLARLNSDGSVDQTFVPNLTSASAAAIKVDGEGRILVAGGFNFEDGSFRSGIARFNPNGSLDTSFNPVVIANSEVLSIALDPSGRILIAGNFSSVNGVPRIRVARLNSDGSLDTTFDPGIGPDNAVHGIEIDGAGRILIAGRFQKVSNINQRILARLDAAGNLDTTFTPAFDDRANVIVPLPNGKLLIGGRFGRIGTTPISNVTRLNPDGSLDTTFSTSTVGGSNSDGVRSLALDSQGRILVGGDFQFSGIGRSYFTRLLPNGTRDISLDAITGPNGPTYGVAVDSNDRMVIGGGFTSFNGVTRFGLVRLFGDTNCSFSVSPTAPNFPASGGTATLTVTAQTGCPWTLAGTPPNWLSSLPNSGSGNGTVQLTAAPNPTTTARSTTLTVAGQSVTISQDPSVTVNGSISLTTISATIAPATCGAQGYANDYVVTAVATNTGPTTLYNVTFEVAELAEANGAPPSVPFRLVSADGADCSSGGLVGSRQTVAAQLAPGAGVTFQFRIALPSIRRFRFLVNALAATAPPLNRFERIRRNSILGPPPSRTKVLAEPSGYFRR